jgi:hypothetical protein
MGGMSPVGVASSRTCYELMTLYKDLTFDFRVGHDDVCSTAKIAGNCYKNAVTKRQAENMCLSLGARLCT